MRRRRRWLRPLLGLAAGALAGLAWYHWFGCTGGCVITSSPVRSMLYLGAVGCLLAWGTGGTEGEDSCNT